MNVFFFFGLVFAQHCQITFPKGLNSNKNKDCWFPYTDGVKNNRRLYNLLIYHHSLLNGIIFINFVMFYKFFGLYPFDFDFI